MVVVVVVVMVVVGGGGGGQIKTENSVFCGGPRNHSKRGGSVCEVVTGAPDILEWCLGPPGPHRPQKSTILGIIMAPLLVSHPRGALHRGSAPSLPKNPLPSLETAPSLP